jgi:phosphopantothenoylcysteine decarboxylase/phosphopantothenate--cysteine ligase
MRVVLGVGGGIAAYKSAELARSLMERGAEVQVVLTAAAEEFIRPLTFAALTNRKVITDLFASRSAEEVLSSSVEHIRVAQDNDVLVVAPATADLIAKFAHGLANDFLTTLYLAFTGKVILAPAMNTNMWEHPAVRANVETLAARGHTILPPDSGLLACGTVGAGRLPDPQKIAEAVVSIGHSRKDLEGESVIITAAGRRGCRARRARHAGFGTGEPARTLRRYPRACR